MYDNADTMLHALGCEKREYYAGACAQLKDIFNLARKYQDAFKLAKGKSDVSMDS